MTVTVPERVEVVVVGAGPVGCALSLLLRARERSVLVVERQCSSRPRDADPRLRFEFIAVGYFVVLEKAAKESARRRERTRNVQASRCRQRLASSVLDPEGST